MYKNYITKFGVWLLNSLKLQLFLNIISIVILIHWGLPISVLSPIGNIIFAPFLTIFLILSSLIFFAELLMISNYWLTFVFESFTNTWLKLLSLGNDSWKIYFIKPPFYISIAIIVLSILAIKFKKIKYNITRIIYLLCIFIFLIIYTKLNTSKKTYDVLYFKNKKIVIVMNQNKINLYDKGVLEIANWQWLQFDLITFLIKKFGHCNIDKLVVKKRTKENENSIKLLIKKCNIQNVVEKT